MNITQIIDFIAFLKVLLVFSRFTAGLLFIGKQADKLIEFDAGLYAKKHPFCQFQFYYFSFLTAACRTYANFFNNFSGLCFQKL